MGKPVLEKLERFDFKKFPELNQHILEGKESSIMDEMKSMYDNLVTFQYQIDQRKKKKQQNESKIKNLSLAKNKDTSSLN